MSDHRFDRLRRRFELADGLPEHERRAFLERECPDDAELRSEVEQLAGMRVAHIPTGGGPDAKKRGGRNERGVRDASADREHDLEIEKKEKAQQAGDAIVDAYEKLSADHPSLVPEKPKIMKVDGRKKKQPTAPAILSLQSSSLRMPLGPWPSPIHARFRFWLRTGLQALGAPHEATDEPHPHPSPCPHLRPDRPG